MSNRRHLPGTMWPFQTEQTKILAASFAEISTQDAKASLPMYQSKLYPQSIYHFQQAVEKASKAYGILSGALRPTSNDLIREVSHRSLMGLMLRVPDLMEKLPAMRQALNKNLDRKKLEKVGAWDLLAPILQERENEDPQATRQLIIQLKRLDPAKLWKASLELDSNHPLTKIVWAKLAEADRRSRDVDAFEAKVFRRFKPLLSEPEDIEYVMNLYGRAAPELVPLGLVSSWHERETRYPPIEKGDYWDPHEYTADKGLVKNYRLFYHHTEKLCRGVLAASKAASVSSKTRCGLVAGHNWSTS